MSTPNTSRPPHIHIQFHSCVPLSHGAPVMLYRIWQRKVWIENHPEIFTFTGKTHPVEHASSRWLTNPMSMEDCEAFMREYNKHPEAFIFD